MNEQNIMRPGDTFVAEECGCSFTVTSGPRDEKMASQAPRCCCGHEMKKQGGGAQHGGEVGINDNGDEGGAPRMMPD